MTNRQVRVITRVLPDGEVIIIVEPILAVGGPQLVVDADRNLEAHRV